MTDTREPADGGYASVRTSSDTFEIWRRRDDWAEHNGLGGARWFCRTDTSQQALTWAGVTGRGPVAYVGEFADRRAA